ncbi:MAG TPA: ABC transporter ATP-binding protein [Methanocella sp.]
MEQPDNHYLLEARDVFKIYRTTGETQGEPGIETVALRGVTLRVRSGELMAIQGPSGCGKSTLLNLIGSLDTPTAGKVLYEGVDTGSLSETERARFRQRQLGFVFQDSNLIPFLTALENAALPLMLARNKQPTRRAREWLERVGLDDRLHHRAGQLSGGEAQRVGIACALANSPQLVLADELTGELDSATGQDIMELIRDVNEQDGTTFIIVTHDDDVAAYARRIVHMKDGLLTATEGEYHA